MTLNLLYCWIRVCYGVSRENKTMTCLIMLNVTLISTNDGSDGTDCLTGLSEVLTKRFYQEILITLSTGYLYFTPNGTTSKLRRSNSGLQRVICLFDVTWCRKNNKSPAYREHRNQNTVSNMNDLQLCKSTCNSCHYSWWNQRSLTRTFSHHHIIL